MGKEVLKECLKELGYTEDFDNYNLTEEVVFSIIVWIKNKYKLHIYTVFNSGVWNVLIQDLKTENITYQTAKGKDDTEIDAYRTGILSACRLIKNGLKQAFDLEKAKQGANLETKLGYKARIVCYDANRSFNLVVLVSEPRGKYYIEEVYFYNEDGIRWEDKYCARNDLVIVPSLNPSNP